MQADSALIEQVTPILERHGFSYLKSGNRFRRKNGKNSDSIRFQSERGNRFSVQYWHWNQAVEDLRADVQGISISESAGWTLRDLEKERKTWSFVGRQLSPEFVSDLGNSILPWLSKVSELTGMRQLLEEKPFSRGGWLTIFFLDKLLNDKEHANTTRESLIQWLSSADLSSQSFAVETCEKLAKKFPDFYSPLPEIESTDHLAKSKEDAEYLSACIETYAGAEPLESEPFRVFVMLGSPGFQFWKWETWQSVSSCFEPLVELARNKTSVRSGQSKNGKALQFGALDWSDSSHQKWAHESPVKNEERDTALFGMLEATAPALSRCEKEKLPPDFLLCLQNEGLSGEVKDYDTTIVFAIREAIIEGQHSQLSTVLHTVASKFNPKLVATLRRPFMFRHNKFHSLIDLPLGIFRPGRAKAIYGAKLESLLGPWTEVNDFDEALQQK
jgi:hypothetical protein